MTFPIAGIIFDIDGTLLRGTRLLPAVCETLQELRARKIKICFFTNDNRAPIGRWLERLSSHGITVHPHEMITSAVVAADTIVQNYPNDNVLVAGDEGLWEALKPHNLQLIGWDSERSADLVLMGKDPHFDQARLQTACQHIWKGAKLLATNNDRKMPVADGYIPGTGAMVQAITYATGVEPIVTGKPSIYAAQTALSRMGLQPHQAVIVGDSLTSDIKLGKTANITTVLTLTGTHGEEDVALLPKVEQPDYIIQDLSELIRILFGGTQ
ncbi:MAG: HAD-IIA family hydrolase [Anaerolineae bacterium]